MLRSHLVIFVYGLKTQGKTIALVAAAGLVVCIAVALVVRSSAAGENFFTSRGGRDDDTGGPDPAVPSPGGDV